MTSRSRSRTVRWFAAILAAAAACLGAAPAAHGAVSYLACDSSHGFSFAPWNLTLTKPAGTAQGDLMVMSIRLSAFYGGAGNPSGWTQYLDTDNTTTFYKVAGASEPASYTFSGLPATSYAGGYIATYRGVDTSAPILGSGAQSNATGSAVSLPGTGLTVNRTGSMRHSGVLVGSNRTATYSGMTEGAGCDDGYNVSSSFAYASASAGTLPAASATLSGSGSWAAQTLIIQPPADPPTVSSLSPSTGPAAGGTSVVITGTNFTGASSVTFGGVSASYVVNSDTQITATSPAGSGTADVRVTTAIGTSANTASDDFVYVPAPTVTGLSPGAGPTAGGTSVVITGTNLSGASAVTFGGVSASYVVDSATQITATSPAGSGTVDVRVTTTGGTSANTAADNYRYAPVPAITSLNPDGGPTAGGTVVTITGTGFTGATAVYFDVTDATTFVVNSDTQITATAPAGAKGSVRVSVVTPGGTTPNTVNDDYRYYGTPSVASVSPSTGPASGGTTVTITGGNFLGVTAVKFGSTDAASFVLEVSGDITATAPAGTGTVDVRVTTPGGTSANTAADDYVYVPAPTVSGLSPSAGPTAGGTSVVITGTNFTGASAVTFGGTPATGYVVDSATQITATAPARSAGVADVRVTTVGGQSANTAADDYTYAATPTVTGLSPSAGPTAGGTSVVITGTNFTGASAVTFGGTPATGYVVNSATQITATAPARSAGVADVRVTTAGGQSANTASDDYTYVSAPTVTGLAPGSGSPAGGTSVVITGTNFTGATSVTFGGFAAAFVVNSATQITATSPAGAGTVDVRVTTAGGTSANTAADNYTYALAPTVVSLAPLIGPPAGGTSVLITGTNLTGATSVTFGGVSASFVVNNATSITATSPAGTGTVDVRVTTPGGTSANTIADDFTYVPCSGGSLSVTPPDILFDPFALNGLDQTRVKQVTMPVVDLTGAGLGWKLQVGGTQFSAGAGKTLPTNAARITGASYTLGGGACAAPATNVTYPLTVPSLPTKATVYNAALATGLGAVNVGLDVALDVPANTQVGTYTSTWTVDIAQGP